MSQNTVIVPLRDSKKLVSGAFNIFSASIPTNALKIVSMGFHPPIASVSSFYVRFAHHEGNLSNFLATRHTVFDEFWIRVNNTIITTKNTIVVDMTLNISGNPDQFVSCVVYALGFAFDCEFLCYVEVPA